jgi:hypothetical protein
MNSTAVRSKGFSPSDALSPHYEPGFLLGAQALLRLEFDFCYA